MKRLVAVLRIITVVVISPISIPYRLPELLDGSARDRNVAFALMGLDSAIGIGIILAGYPSLSVFLFMIFCAIVGGFLAEIVIAIKARKREEN